MSDHPDPSTVVHTPTHHVAETPPMHDAVDEWHDHSHDERPQRAHADVQNSNLVLGVGIALAAVIAISSLIVYGFYIHYNTQRMVLRERTPRDGAFKELDLSPTEDTRKFKSADLGLLENGGTTKLPTEKENEFKTITISPISRAMDEVAQRYTSRKTAQGN